MKFRTEISLAQQHNQIDYQSKILLLGSCFAENIGKKLEYFKFQNTINPFGILFHPKAIETLITNAVNQKEYIEDDLFFYNELWYCFDAHSVLSNVSKEQLLLDLNSNLKRTYKQIYKSTHIIITFGTAWIYKHIKNDQIVANCHKSPQKEFKKEILSVDKIVKSIETIVGLIYSLNQDIQIIYTVSPVRHNKDGFVENSRSKSHLISAIHQVINCKSKISNKKATYFPSYEIMMDELRDYRFYEEDMIHPNQTATNYIWNKFQHVWISSEALSTMDEVEIIQKGLGHKPFNPTSISHLQFLQNLEIKKTKLQDKFSHIRF